MLQRLFQVSRFGDQLEKRATREWHVSVESRSDRANLFADGVGDRNARLVREREELGDSFNATEYARQGLSVGAMLLEVTMNASSSRFAVSRRTMRRQSEGERERRTKRSVTSSIAVVWR